MKRLQRKIPVTAMFLIAASAANSVPLCTGLSAYGPIANQVPKTIISFKLDPGRWDCTAALNMNADKASIQSAKVSISETVNKIENFPRTATSGASGGPGYALTAQTVPNRIETTVPLILNVNAMVFYTGGTIELRAYYHCVNTTISN